MRKCNITILHIFRVQNVTKFDKEVQYVLYEFYGKRSD